jgi:tetratricopeptide (TPR) repeat protein
MIGERVRRNMKRCSRILAAVLMLTAASVFTYAGGSREKGAATERARGGTGVNEEIDYLGVAAIMVRDGYLDRAREALANVDPTNEDLDRARFHTVRGLLRMHIGEYNGAVEDFQEAMANGQTDPVMQAYVAQAYYAMGNYRDAVDAMDALGNRIIQFPDLYGMKSQSLWQLDKPAEAFYAIQEAIDRYPERHQFLRQKIFFLIQMNLNRAAAEASKEYLQKTGDDPEAYLTIGEALRRGRELDQAILTLERAKLRYPRSERILLSLAQAYADRGNTLVAARLVEEAAVYNPDYTHEAAELYRRGGDLQRSLYLNSQVVDARTKARQRFSLLLQQSRYEEALALEARLARLGALDDDSMRYAMAYVQFQAQRYQRAREYLNQISSAEFFREATQLRRAIEIRQESDYQYF